MAKEKTGEVFYRDENGQLWLAESFVDENGEVVTQDIIVEEEEVLVRL